MKDTQTHKKHGDRTEIIETTIIPQGRDVNAQPLISHPTTSGTMTMSSDQPHVISSQPITLSSVQPHVISSQPIQVPLSEPEFRNVNVGENFNTQPGTTVRKIIDKTTIEHHDNKKEGLKEKAKDAADKILGFIPNPFQHKDKATEGVTGQGLKQNVPITTTTTTTIPQTSSVPLNEAPIKTTKVVTEYPSSGTTHLSCDKEKL